jgi:hypothetical protein
MCRSWTRSRTRVPAWGVRCRCGRGVPGGGGWRARCCRCGRCGRSRGCRRSGRRGWPWGGRVSGGRGGAARDRAVQAPGVVAPGEGVEQRLELGKGGGLVGLRAEPLLHRLLESFGFPWVWGWPGLPFFCRMPRRRSSCSRALRPPEEHSGRHDSIREPARLQNSQLTIVPHCLVKGRLTRVVARMRCTCRSDSSSGTGHPSSRAHERCPLWRPGEEAPHRRLRGPG